MIKSSWPYHPSHWGWHTWHGGSWWSAIWAIAYMRTKVVIFKHCQKQGAVMANLNQFQEWAISLAHSVGCTGTRCQCTWAHRTWAHRDKSKRGCMAMLYCAITALDGFT